MGVSPSQVISQTGDHSCPKQTTPNQACEFCAEYIHSEPLESKKMLGSEAVENAPSETSSADASIPNNEKHQAFCGDVTDGSSTDHLVPPPEDMSTGNQTYNTSCSRQNTSEQKHEIGAKFTHNELSEHKHQLCFQISSDEPGRNSSVYKATLLPVYENMSNSSQPDSRKTLNCHSGNRCNELDADCVRSEPVDQKYQVDSEIILNYPGVIDGMLPSGGVHENTLTVSEGMTRVCPNEPLHSPPRDAKNSCQAVENSCPQQSVLKQTIEACTGTSCNITGNLGVPLEVVKSTPIDQQSKQPEVPIITPSIEHLGLSSDEKTKVSCIELLERPNYVANNSARLGCQDKIASKSLKKKYMLRGCDRVLRSRSSEKPKAPEPGNNLADVSAIGERKRKKLKNVRGKRIVADEFSRMRKHLRYLLNRINYEQSLIAAYSGEGWKGLSIEKLKPEKELQRATAEILRRKLKIRDLFQHLDSLCAEGAFPKSLFDSEGQIDSEDIYCAKCGTKNWSADNDIILCDGACDRGFHQYCLEPPLLKEDIPPDDEGWLCPGCDCKVDCIDLVNELLGTKLFITDNWEKVFPEAAAGHNQDPNFGLPSDDSDDNDYDPDGPVTDKQEQGDESSSDESDFTSTSVEVEAPADDKGYFGLPSDDSEDDDEYDPDAPELDEKVTQESTSSSSDFTSDSEDLDAVLEDNMSSGNEEDVTVSPLGYSNAQISKLGGNNRSVNNELLSSLELAEVSATPVYEKRSIERLDYKKLYDETYGNVPTDSSDDEYWSAEDEPQKRTKSTREGSSVSPDRKTPGRRKSTNDVKENLNKTDDNPKRRGRRKSSSEDTNISLARSHEISSTPSSLGKRDRSSYQRLGEDVTQKLYNSFKENQYPDRTTKESLAKELGLTYSQVSKWFENTRWSFNHQSSRNAKLANSEKIKPQSNKKTVGRFSGCNGTENVESCKKGVDDKGCSSGNVKDGELATPESTTRLSRKRTREGKLGDQPSDRNSKFEVVQGLPASSPKAIAVQTNERTRSKRNSAV